MLDNIQPPIVNKSSNASANALNQSDKLAQQENSEFSFEDILDVINPLQHIPIVSNIYKEQTQDDISNQAKSVGDILYGFVTGGVFGVLSALGNTILKQETSKDASEHLMAFISEEDKQQSRQNIASMTEIYEGDDELVDNNSTQQQQDRIKQTEIASQKDDFWSVRMKQLYGDDNFG